MLMIQMDFLYTTVEYFESAMTDELQSRPSEAQLFKGNAMHYGRMKMISSVEETPKVTTTKGEFDLLGQSWVLHEKSTMKP